MGNLVTGRVYTRSELLEIILKATETCAPVTVVISKDSLLITSCPPRVLNDFMANLGGGWTASIHEGGLHITAK